MIELINLSIDIIILLVKDYHIRLREEQERQENNVEFGLDVKVKLIDLLVCLYLRDK